MKSLRKKALHIAFPFILIANLLFSQVAINLLHDAHDFHQPVTELQKKGAATVQTHGEHCKVCGLEAMFHLFHQQQDKLQIRTCNNLEKSIDIVADLSSVHPFVNGRAPPVV
jgi:hypothetical protein